MSRGGSSRNHFSVTPPAPSGTSTRYATHSNGLRYPPSQACQCLSMNELVISNKRMLARFLIGIAGCDNRVKKTRSDRQAREIVLSYVHMTMASRWHFKLVGRTCRAALRLLAPSVATSHRMNNEHRPPWAFAAAPPEKISQPPPLSSTAETADALFS
jgi:hypothetical protein